MKSSLTLVLLGGLAIIASGCTDLEPEHFPTTPAADAGAAEPVKQPGEKYTLRPTDILHVEMYQEQDFRYDVSVSQEGDIALPLIDRTHVAGHTLKEAKQMLTEKYKAYFKDPNLVIIIQRYAERKVYVDGMVGQPGPVPFPNEENMTISRAIAAARGVLPRGARNDVKLTRNVNGKDVTITIDMNDVSSGRAPDIELQENDRIYVRDSNI